MYRLLILVVLVCAGCSKEEAPPVAVPETPPAPQAQQAPAPVPAPAAPDPAGPATSDPNAVAPAPADSNAAPASDPATTLANTKSQVAEAERLQAAVRKAIESAAIEEDKYTEPCERGYAGVTAVLKSLKESAPEAANDPPPQAKFMKVCKSLPEGMQRCLSVNYALQNMPECQAMAQQLTPEQRKRMEDLAPPDKKKAP